MKLNISAFKTELLQVLIDNTKKYADYLNGVVEEAPVEYSDKVKSVIKLLDTGTFGCNTTAVKEYTELIIGESFEYERKDKDVTGAIRSDFFPYVSSISGESGGHDYAHNKPFVNFTSDRALIMKIGSFRIGNHLPTADSVKELYKAFTEAEVKTWFDTLDDEDVTSLFKKLYKYDAISF